MTKQDVRRALLEANPGRQLGASLGYVERHEGVHVVGVIIVDGVILEMKFRRGEERWLRDAMVKRIKAASEKMQQAATER